MVGGEETKHLVSTILGEISIGKRWLVSAIIVVILVATAIVGDYYTGYTHQINYYNNIYYTI